VFDWPADGKLVVPGLMNSPKKAWLLTDRKEKSLAVATGSEGLTITVPTTAPDPISSTLVLTINGAPKVEQVTIVQDFDGSLILVASEATLRGKTIRYEEGSERNSLGFWTDPADFATWDAKIQKPGKFEVSVEAAATGKSALTFGVSDKSVQGPIQATGDYGKFRNIKLGTIEIGATGKAVFSLKAVADGWQPVNVRAIRLKPVAN
jgi:alpha-L-fucosidase